MITMNESSNWIGQHAIFLICAYGVFVILVGLTCIGGLIYSIAKDSALPIDITNPRVLAVPVAITLAVVLLPYIMLNVIDSQDARYSGSADYTIEKVKTQSSGDQTIVINDGKSDVELEVDDDDKTSYAKGDKVNVKAQSYDKSKQGKHHLSDVLKADSGLVPAALNTHYNIKKID